MKVEYSWGLARGIYFSKLLKMNKGKSQFKYLVDKVTSKEFLNTQKIRKVSAQARAYIQSVFSLDSTDELNSK